MSLKPSRQQSSNAATAAACESEESPDGRTATENVIFHSRLLRQPPIGKSVLSCGSDHRLQRRFQVRSTYNFVDQGWVHRPTTVMGSKGGAKFQFQFQVGYNMVR